MIKYRLIATAYALLLVLNGFAQTRIEVDQRLNSKFSEVEIQGMSDAELTYWVDFMNHSTEIIDLPTEKLMAVQGTVELPSLEPKDINIFELGIEPQPIARSYRRIAGSDQVLVVRSLAEIETFVPALSVQNIEEENNSEVINVSAAMGGGGALVIPIDGPDVSELPCGFGAGYEHSFQDDNTAAPYPANAN
ncbi:MAG: hypothetical protein RL266_1010, partial [Bacteroidota bacterium]